LTVSSFVCVFATVVLRDRAVFRDHAVAPDDDRLGFRLDLDGLDLHDLAVLERHAHRVDRLHLQRRGEAAP
jgi:hypothetical protein